MMNKKYLQIVVLVIGVLVLGLIVWSVLRLPGGSAPLTAVTQQQNASTTATGASPSVTAATPTNPSQVASKASAISITSPEPNAQWIFQGQHTIQWSRAAGARNGTLSLMDASTGAVVGWIQQQISPQQTMFPWNTRDLFVSATSPLKKDVPPGRYRIALTFNSPNIPPVVGPVFSIITQAEAQVPVLTIIIQGASFSSSSATVSQGTKIIFVNRDAASYKINVSPITIPFTVGPLTSQTFDTSIFSSGNYVFYSTAYPSLRLTVTIKNKTQ